MDDNELITPYTNVPIAGVDEATESRYGSDFFRDVNELQVGSGSNVLRVDQQGLWLGAEKFADAPFSVDMQGNVTATSLSLGTLSGSLDDIADGSTYAKTTFDETLGASYAYGGLNSSGEIIKGFLNSQLSSKSLPTNGVRVDSNGIYGRKAGSTTFYIDSSGNAYFTGSIAASSMSASTITGSTITGTTLSTATSGQRVVLTSTLAQYYNSSGTKIVETYAASNAFIIKGMQSNSYIYLDAGSSGWVAFLGNGSIKAVFDNANSRFAPYSNGGLSLGASGAAWDSIYAVGTFRYQAVDQPVRYAGRVYNFGSAGFDWRNDLAWSVTRLGTGRVRITHSLGHTDYSANATAIRGSGAGAYIAKIESYSSSNFVVTTFDDTGVAVDSDFMFTVDEAP